MLSPNEFNDLLGYVNGKRNVLLNMEFLQRILKSREDKEKRLSMHVVVQNKCQSLKLSSEDFRLINF